MTPETTSARSTRAAVVDGPAQLSVRTVELPALAGDEVLIGIEYCGVCGTDLHTVLDGWSQPGTVAGHEWSGRVIDVGSEVTRWQPGDLVVGGAPSCGTCRWCVAGRPALCEQDPLRTGEPGHGGAFAELHIAPERSLHRVPDSLALRAAALAEPLAVALHGLTNAALPDDASGLRVLVSGAGPLGLLVIAALAARGATDITVSEPAAPRRDRATAAGAAVTLDPGDLPAAPDLPTQCRDDGFDVAFETSGKAAAIGAALGLLNPAGRLVLLGTGSMSARLDPIRILLNELVVTGAYCYDHTGIDDALALLASGRLPLDVLMSPEDVSLEGLIDAMHALKSGETSTKVLVKP